MLRYFYLFCLLLVCIDWCFCNDISHQNHGVPVNGLKNHQKVKHINKNDKMKVKNTRPVYEVPGGEDHVAEIDVLGFIQQPEYDAIKDDGFEDDGSYYGHINKRRSYYDDYGSMKMPHRNVKKRQDFSNSEFSDPSYGQNVNSIDINLPSINNEAITTEKTSIRKQAKKLAFKLPFFSRKKTTDVGKKKKKAKRLKTCARCTKKSISKTTLKSINPNGSQRNNEVKISDTLSTTSKMYHNSRQYFQDTNIKNEKNPKNIN